MSENKVVIVGAGLAGMAAAYEACREGADVLLLDRGPAGLGTNSSLANGYFTAPSSSYGAEAYIKDTLEAGRHINQFDRVQLIVREAPKAFQFLRSLGLRVKETSISRIVESDVSGVIPGVCMMKKFSELICRQRGIQIATGFYVTDIVVRNHQVCGIRGIHKTGEETCISASSVILATGGAGAIYSRNDNQKKILGQGYYLAAKAGLKLWDMEFVQFFPLVIAEPHLPQLILFPPYPSEAKLMNARGEDILAKYGLGDINHAIMKNRDVFSARLVEENQGSQVYMDFREIPDPLWSVHPFTVLKKLRFDFRQHPVAVSPAAHFSMGGVRADETGQTEMDGLFACGEILWGLHGANRMGGNALTECLVTGAMAGRHAAGYCRSWSGPSLPDEDKIGSALVQGFPFRETIKGLLLKVRETASRHGGVVRSEEGIMEGLLKVAELKREAGEITTVSRDRGEKVLKEDLMSALFVLEAILTASLGRKESRGSFIRTDFPREDNMNWRGNSCLQYDREEKRFSLSYVNCEP